MRRTFRQLIQAFGLPSGPCVIGLLHHGLILLPLLRDLRDLSIEGMRMCAGSLGLVVKSVKSECQEEGDRRQRTHGDAQVLHRRGEIGKWPRSKIYGYAHSRRLLPMRR